MLNIHFELVLALTLFVPLQDDGKILDKNINMNKNYSYSTTMYESILTQMYAFLVLFTLFVFYRDFLSKNWKKHFSKNTFMHCSQITVVHVYVYTFL